MPTVLTAKIYDGEELTLREFALRCATQFSPAHSYNGDLPLDKAPVLENSSIDYYERRLKEAREELKEVNRLKEHPEEVERIIEQKTKNIEEENNRRKIRYADMRKRYDAMIANVERFQVPEEYKYLRDFMLKHLKETKEHDCPEDCFQREVKPISPKVWIAQQLKYIHDTIGYFEEKLVKGKEWYANANKHLQGLYKAIDEYEKQTNEL